MEELNEQTPTRFREEEHCKIACSFTLGNTVILISLNLELASKLEWGKKKDMKNTDDELCFSLYLFKHKECMQMV